MILMAVRWYVAYALSYRNIEELMAERGSAVSHATSIVGWSSMLLYSKNLSEFLEKAIGYSEIPDKVTIDKSGANKAGLEAIKRIVNPMMGFKAFLHSAEATLAESNSTTC